MKKCLLAVQGPFQYLAGLIAMEWYWQIDQDASDTQTTLLLYDFMCCEEQEQLLADSIMRLAALKKWDKIVFIKAREMDKISRQHYSGSIKDFKRIAGQEHFDQVYLARDFGGFGSSLIINAYPKARRIIYGDSFGTVGDEEIFSSHFNWRAFLQRLIYGGPVRFGFDTAVLALPMDWSGSYLDKIPLIIPPRDHILRMMEGISGQLNDLNGYCDALLEGSDKSCLFLLACLHKSGFMSKENEVRMYQEIIRQTAAKDETVIIKDHPRSPPDVLHAVVSALKKDYKIKVIDDPGLSRLPIELWSRLIQDSRVAAVYSTSALNLNYLYGKDVILPLDEDKIRKYFYRPKVPFMIKAYRSIDGSIENLKTWDGCSVLWKGNQGGLKDAYQD